MKNMLLTGIIMISVLYQIKAQDTLPECTIINADEDNSLLSVYPNPTDGTFKIIYASKTECPPPGWGGEIMISVTNENGQVAFSEILQNFEGEYERLVDLSNYEKGTYIVAVVAGRQKWVKREILK